MKQNRPASSIGVNNLHRYLYCGLVALTSARGAGVASAQIYATPPVIVQSLPVVAVDREVWASFDAQDTGYKEHFPADVQGHDREHGWTPGFGVGARWMSDVAGITNVYAAIAYHHQSGTIDYDGTTFATNTPLVGSSGLTTNDVIGELGKGFLLTPNFIVIPELQVGYHAWHRTLTTDENEDYSHGLMGAAVRANYAFTPRLIGTLRAGIAGMIDPKIDIHFDGYYPQSLGSSAILQAGAKLDYALTRQLHVFAAGDVQQFDYGASKGSPFGNDGIIFEPSSTTTQITLGTGVAYAF